MILPKMETKTEFVCQAQKKRNSALNTFKPCNNCIYYRWSFPSHKYHCKASGSFMNSKKRGGF